MPLDAVGVEKFSADAHDFIAAPIHNHAPAVCDFSDDISLKIFLVGKRDKFLNVIFIQDNRHALLAFGNGKLGAVKPVVFFSDSIKIYFQARRKFADGNSNTARAEVVATFD